MKMNEETEQKQEDEPLEMNLLEKGSQKPVSKTDEVPKTTESEPLENTPKTTEDEPVESNPSENDSKEVKGILEDTRCRKISWIDVWNNDLFINSCFFMGQGSNH